MLRDEILDRIEAHDMARPRGLQVEPGPSDLANECDHCLAAKLAGWPKRQEPAWLPYMGTAIHAQLEQAMAGLRGWQTEVQVTVGTLGGKPVTGSADLLHLPSKTVIDYKTASAVKIREARKGVIPGNYLRQINLYARGLEAERVAILFLPRTAMSVREAVWWDAPADPALGHATMQRARDIREQVEAGRHPSLFDRQAGCYDCARYGDYAETLIPNRQISSMAEIGEY